MDRYHRKQNKIEKTFFSRGNIELLDSVIPDSTKKNLGNDYVAILEAEMATAFRKTNTPHGLSKNERRDYIQQLNKAVLANVVKMVGPRMTPAIGSNQGNYQYGWGPTNSEGLAPFNPPSGDGKREIVMPRRLTREELMPGKPDLHPRREFQEFPQPPASTRDRGLEMKIREPTKDALSRVEDERAQLFRKEEPRSMDFTLPKAKDIDEINPEDRLQQVLMEREKDDRYLASQPPPEKDLEGKQIKMTQHRVSQKVPVSRPLEKPQPKDFHPAFSSDSIVDGLDEDFLTVNNVNEDLKDQREIMVDQGPMFEEKDSYLTINSRYRDLSQYPSPYNFTLTTDKVETDTSEVLFNDTVIFSYNENSRPSQLKEEDLRNVMVVECLDISVPRSLQDALEEPYLWLAIDEWGELNKGTGIPEHAFARLRPMPSNDRSAFITMRAHMLERHVLRSRSTSTLTFRLLRSDGEELDYEGPNDLDKDIDINEWIYVYSYYPPKDMMVTFQQNLFVYSLKHNKKGELSFKIYLDESEDIGKNKIGRFRNEKNKHRLPVNKYLSSDDLFFMEFSDQKNDRDRYVYSRIIKVQDEMVTIELDHMPKTIERIGFLKRDRRGFVSERKDDINYKNGHQYSKVKKMLEDNLIDPRNYFFIKRKDQVSCMFRLLQRI